MPLPAEAEPGSRPAGTVGRLSRVWAYNARMASRTTQKQRDRFIGARKAGATVGEACEAAEFSRDQYHHLRRTDEDFQLAWEDAEDFRNEKVEKVVLDLALEGDLKAALEWLKVHRKRWKPMTHLTLDATDNLVQVTRNQAIANIAELGKALEQRRRQLERGVIDV